MSRWTLLTAGQGEAAGWVPTADGTGGYVWQQPSQSVFAVFAGTANAPLAGAALIGGEVDNWTALQNLITSVHAAGGGYVYIPPALGAYGIDIVTHGALQVPDGVGFLGAGLFSQLRVLNENLAAPRRHLFECATNTNVIFRDLVLWGPQTIQVTNGGIVDMIIHDGQSGSVTLDNAKVLRGSYGLRCGAGGVVNLTTRNKTEFGFQAEFGLLTNAVVYATATDKTRIRVDDTYFHDIGGTPASGGEDVQSGINQQHGIYFPPLHNANVTNSIFENITGYGVHCHGSVGATAGDYYWVDKCEFRTTAAFDANAGLSMHGAIETSNRVTTKITGNQFNQTPQYTSITVNGDVIIDRNDFRGAEKAGGASHIKFEAANISGAQSSVAKVSRNNFIGATDNAIWQPQPYPVTLELDKNTFSSADTQNVKVDAAAANTRLYCRDSTFNAPGLGTACLRLDGGFVAEIRGNHFYNPVGTWALDSAATSAAYEMLVRSNEFSGAGAAIRARAPFALNPPSGASGANVGITTSVGTATGSLPAGTYYYGVAARNANGLSPISAQVTAVLAVTGNASIFYPRVGGATGYRIYRSTVSGNFTNATYWDVPVQSANSIQDFFQDTNSLVTSTATATGTATPVTTSTAVFTTVTSTGFLSDGNYGSNATGIPGASGVVVTSGQGETAGAAPVADGAGGYTWAVSSIGEPRTVPYTVYVDQLAGSDTNNGSSPGQAFSTITKAVNFLQAGGHGGRIRVLTSQAGFYNVAAPIAIVRPILIESLTNEALAIARTFSTPNGRSVWDAVTTASGASVSSATAAFVAGDVNRIVSIYGAGSGGGTYYGFIPTIASSTTANLPSNTAIARSATTDPLGVKMSIVGDWNRVVTDASITSGQSVVTSLTASWTSADIGTEIVIAAAGRGGQALRSAIVAVSGNTATIAGVATTTVSGVRCAIGVNFGDLFTYHYGQGGILGAGLYDNSVGNNSIGAAIKLCYDDDNNAGSLPSDLTFEDVRVTSSDAAGAWEHAIDVDGSWNQRSGGPAWRRVNWRGLKLFGVRRATETIRLVSGCHHWFTGGGLFEAPTAIGQGIIELDPLFTGASQRSCVDVHFAAFENQGYYYSEGQYCTFVGGRCGADQAVSGRVAIHHPANADHCLVATQNAATANTGVTNVGTACHVVTNEIDVHFGSSANVAFQMATVAGANLQLVALTTATAQFRTNNNSDIDIYTNNVLRARFAKTGSFIAQLAGALATNATDGFLYLPTCAGTPTGTPTAVAGAVPLVFDTTGAKLWIFTGGAWKGVVVA